MIEFKIKNIDDNTEKAYLVDRQNHKEVELELGQNRSECILKIIYRNYEAIEHQKYVLYKCFILEFEKFELDETQNIVFYKYKKVYICFENENINRIKTTKDTYNEEDILQKILKKCEIFPIENVGYFLNHAKFVEREYVLGF